ncbi:GIY-YIG nuclease family protein [Nocardioides sp. NPDC023903]|uniref:GIY-YIG nuclease family protein n=1 Tax=Nocardioides sp. NPDC023903 TaxID=3157195 RepID=UPI0033F97F43
MSTDPEWAALLSATRFATGTLSRGEIPRSPGVYAWFHDGECVYVGKASNLRRRIGTHLSTSLDLSRCTLRASVAVKTLGVTRKHARSRPTVMTVEEIAVVTAWFATAEVNWLECETRDEAHALKGRLLESWTPEMNLI